MKKILLLAVAAAPLFSVAAQTTPGEAILKYELPQGTFFSGTNALLPPAVQLEWINTSYYYAEGPITDASFQWLLNSRTIGSETNLTAPVAVAMPGVNIASSSAPILTAPGTTDAKYSFTGNIFYGQGNADMTTFKTFTGLETTEFDPFVIGSTEANALWTSLNPGISNINVTGFAQEVAYPGAPYTLSSITVPGADKASFTISVFKAPEKEGALPTDLIFSAKAEGGKVSPSTTISSDIVIVIDEFAGKFEAQVAVAKAEPAVPIPANQGLSALLTGMSSDGTQTTVMAQYNEIIDNVIPVALDLELGISYSFFVPATDIDANTSLAGQEKITVSFDKFTTMAQYLCVTNADPDDITITLADGNTLPSWLSYTVERATVKGTDDEGKEVENECNQAVIVTFSQTSTTGGTTPVVINFPNGTYTGFTVTTEGTTGIENVASEAAVVAREYYDINGRRLNQAPRSGIYIEKAIKADGTVEATSRIR